MLPQAIADAIITFQNAAFVHASAREREAFKQSKVDMHAARAELERVIATALLP
jgi:hypothetical protein